METYQSATYAAKPQMKLANFSGPAPARAAAALALEERCESLRKELKTWDALYSGIATLQPIISSGDAVQTETLVSWAHNYREITKQLTQIEKSGKIDPCAFAAIDTRLRRVEENYNIFPFPAFRARERN